MKVEDKVGFWKNSATSTIWELSAKDGQLIVNVPNFSFQISPISETKFRPVDTLINLDIQFETRGPNEPLLMHLFAKGIQRATFFHFYK